MEYLGCPTCGNTEAEKHESKCNKCKQSVDCSDGLSSKHFYLICNTCAKEVEKLP